MFGKCEKCALLENERDYLREQVKGLLDRLGGPVPFAGPLEPEKDEEWIEFAPDGRRVIARRDEGTV